MYIFKLFRIEEWLQFEALGKTDGAPIDVMDGFIHFAPNNFIQYFRTDISEILW